MHNYLNLCTKAEACLSVRLYIHKCFIYNKVNICAQAEIHLSIFTWILKPSNLCTNLFFVFSCGHATPKEALSVRPSRSTCQAQVENAKDAYLGCFCWYCLCVRVLEGCWGVVGVRLGWDAPTHLSATTLWPRVHLFTKVTIIKSRLRIATYLYFSIFVSSPYVNCSSDGVLAIFYCSCKRKRLHDFCVL